MKLPAARQGGAGYSGESNKRRLGFPNPQRSGHCVPLSFAAFGGKIQATRCAGGRCLSIFKYNYAGGYDSDGITLKGERK
jgi:hypothetical protein